MVKLSDKGSVTKAFSFTAGILFRIVPGYMVLDIILNMLSGTVDAAAAMFFARSIDEAARLGAGGRIMALFAYIAAYVLFLHAVPYVLDIFSDIMDARMRMKLSVETVEMTVRRAVKAPLSYVEDPEYQNLMSQISGIDSNFLLGYFHRYVYMLYFVVKFLSLIAVFFSYNRMMSFILLVNFVITILVNLCHTKMSVRFQLELTEEERRESYYRDLILDREAAKDIKVLDAYAYFEGLYREQAKKVYTKRIAFDLKLARLQAAASIVKMAISFGVFAYGIHLIGMGELTAGGFILYYNISENLVSYFDLFMRQWGNVRRENVTITRFLSFIRHMEEESTGEKALGAPEVGIVFENVQFRYREDTPLVLKDLSFELRPGEKLALIGENGAGKSTIIRLMTGLERPTSGKIKVNGTDMEELNLPQYRQRISLVAQDFCRYYLPVRYNIGLSDYQRMEDDKGMYAASEKGGTYEFISGFPGRLDQLLGTQYHDGMELSGGQWQKLSLSRGYFKQGSFLIMDEPTSALDAAAEERIYNQFVSLSEKSTAVFVSHRMASAQLADKIACIKDGQIVEFGSHHELMAKGGYYAALYLQQAELYR